MKDPRFGNIVILSHIDDPTLQRMKKTIKNKDQDSHNLQKELSLDRNDMNHDNLLKMHLITENKKRLLIHEFYDYPQAQIMIDKLKQT